MKHKNNFYSSLESYPVKYPGRKCTKDCPHLVKDVKEYDTRRSVAFRCEFTQDMKGSDSECDAPLSDNVIIEPPEIVFCKDCERHNVTLQQAHWDKSKACPLIEWRGKSKGHEFDYQFCVCGKKKQNLDAYVSRSDVLDLIDRVSSSRELSDYDKWYESIRDGVFNLTSVSSDRIKEEI